MMQLTKSEEQIMQILWKQEKAFVKEIVEEFDVIKPAYNTVSTIVRILEKKGFVAHETFGKTHRYYPIVPRSEYKKSSLKKLMDGYFNKSYKNLVSFFSKEEDLSIEEMEEIRELMNKKISKIKKQNS